VKFTERGTVRVSLSEICRDGGTRLLFEVVDTGIGIAEEARPRLFNAFSQVDGTISRRFGGTGLGLAICKRIVENLDGKIGLDSEVGEGSRFWFEVPVSAIAAPAPAPSREDAAMLPRLKVLLVEDNAVNREVASQFLHKLGQDVSIAIDGAQAVRLASEEDFDLILMDMQMPVMDGIAATKAIRAQPGKRRTVPIVAMTANASDADRRRCVEAGMTGFQSKPISMAQLAAIVANHAPAEERRRVPSLVSGATVSADATPARAEPDHDRDRVAELVDAVGEEGFRHLVDVFFADAGALLADLGRAMATGDAELGDRTLHSLKGSASNLGFTSLVGLAENLRKERLDAAAAARIAAELARLSASRIDKAA
jgi:CheY-like chemotaxis protein/HPt (histidine-containing phosphotransfer) domain-containing protein